MTSTAQDIVEGNKIIAEFYSVKHEIDTGREYYLLPDMKTQARTGWYQPHDMIFHTSWDWLKPVIDKLYECTSEDKREFSGEALFEYGIAIDIDTAWQAVVSFIKFYNSQNGKD